MARPSSVPKSPVSIAMIKMRHHLGMTQAELARALRVALPTVGRWESWDPPQRFALGLLAVFADCAGDLRTAAVFRRALKKEDKAG
jgi:DNA-binding transcriptional regulator YiaG